MGVSSLTALFLVLQALRLIRRNEGVDDLAGRDYRDNPLWFSSPVVSPIGKGWDFWQYSHSASLTGYSGPEACIDLNVFRGSMEEFRRFGCPD